MSPPLGRLASRYLTVILDHVTVEERFRYLSLLLIEPGLNLSKENSILSVTVRFFPSPSCAILLLFPRRLFRASGNLADHDLKVQIDSSTLLP